MQLILMLLFLILKFDCYRLLWNYKILNFNSSRDNNNIITDNSNGDVFLELWSSLAKVPSELQHFLKLITHFLSSVDKLYIDDAADKPKVTNRFSNIESTVLVLRDGIWYFSFNSIIV